MIVEEKKNNAEELKMIRESLEAGREQDRQALTSIFQQVRETATRSARTPRKAPPRPSRNSDLSPSGSGDDGEDLRNSIVRGPRPAAQNEINVSYYIFAMRNLLSYSFLLKYRSFCDSSWSNRIYT